MYLLIITAGLYAVCFDSEYSVNIDTSMSVRPSDFYYINAELFTH